MTDRHPAHGQAAPASAKAARQPFRIEPMTCAIGAELTGLNLGDAVRDDGLFNEIYAALLQYKVLFLRDQTLDRLSRQDHMAFAMRLGELETHPMAPSHPDAPGLVQIYKNPDSPIDRYENAWHTDGTWRETPALGCVLRCIECPPVGGDTMWANMVLAYDKLPGHVKTEIEGLIASHSFNASFAAAMPQEQAPGDEGAVPRRRASGRAHPPGNRREGAVRQCLHHALRQLPHQGPRALRPGLQQERQRPDAVPDQPGLQPRVPGPLALEALTAWPSGTTARPSTTR